MSTVTGTGNAYKRIVTDVSHWLAYMAAALILAMMMLTVVDVFLRYFFNAPINGAFEITELMMVLIFAPVLAWTSIMGANVRVDLIIGRFPNRTQGVFDGVTCLFSIFVTGVITWFTVPQAVFVYNIKTVSDQLEIPFYPFFIVIAIGFFLLVFALISNLIDSVNKAVRGMSNEVIGLLGILALIILLFSRMWIGFAMAFVGFIGLVFLYSFDRAGIVMATIPFNRVGFYPITALALFVLMGVVVGAAGLSGDLYTSAYKWLGRLPGGLAIATVFAAGGFACISGSSTATAVTIGKVSLPEMKRYNYDPRLATGTVAAGGTIGILIPPSLGFILYAVLTEQSIGKLFMAGIIPGIMEVLFYSILILGMCMVNPKMGPRGPKVPMREKIVSLKNIWPVMILFVFVIGGIYLGWFTPTEAGAIGAFASIVIVMAMGRLNFKGLLSTTMEATQITGMVLILMVGAFIFANFLAVSRLPFALADVVTGISVHPYVVLTAIIVVYIILGMFLDIFSSILLTMPILFPVIVAMGFDPIWFGVIMVRIMEIGLITPPIGMNVFVMASVTDVPLGTIFRGIVPFVIADIIHVAVLVALPQLSLFLPNTMFSR